MSQHAFFYIGTYTKDILHGTGNILHGKGKGIYSVSLNKDTGEIDELELEAAADNPSFLCVSPDKKYLYAVNELKQYEDKPQGSLSSFMLAGGTKLKLLNRKPTLGTDPCHVVTSHSGKFAAVTNFMSGSVCLYNIKPDGSLQSDPVFMQHAGSGVNLPRQAGPHAHAAMFDRNDRYVYVPDLGLDEIVIYRLEGKLPQLKLHSAYKSKPGAGPRYCELHPHLDVCYLINELDSTIDVMMHDKSYGSLKHMQTVPTLEGNSGKTSIAAALRVSPDGRYLYGSNRGEDSIVIFSIDTNGRLSYVGHENSGGFTPRDFCIVAGGDYLVVANQDSDKIVVFKINKITGKLSYSSEVYIPTPVCVCNFLD